MRGYVLLDIRETDHCGMDRNACTASESMNTESIYIVAWPRSRLTMKV